VHSKAESNNSGVQG